MILSVRSAEFVVSVAVVPAITSSRIATDSPVFSSYVGSSMGCCYLISTASTSSCLARGDEYLFVIVILIAIIKVNDAVVSVLCLVPLTRCNLEARRLRNP